jgi:hypothetical protein
VLQKKCTGVKPHYFDVWEPAHQGNADAVERLLTISFILTQYLLSSYLTQYFVGPIYGGVEEDPWARGTRLEVSSLLPHRCVCYGRRYLAWKVSEYINYCLKLSIVRL